MNKKTATSKFDLVRKKFVFPIDTQEICFLLQPNVEKDIENNGINHKCGFEQGYCQNVLLESMWAWANSGKK